MGEIDPGQLRWSKNLVDLPSLFPRPVEIFSKPDPLIKKIMTVQIYTLRCVFHLTLSSFLKLKIFCFNLGCVLRKLQNVSNLLAHFPPLTTLIYLHLFQSHFPERQFTLLSFFTVRQFLENCYCCNVPNISIYTAKNLYLNSFHLSRRESTTHFLELF